MCILYITLNESRLLCTSKHYVLCIRDKPCISSNVCYKDLLKHHSLINWKVMEVFLVNIEDNKLIIRKLR